jgi:PPOX class probable F420-dependent enzyme
MASLDDPAVRALLEAPNYAVVSTHNRDGSIHSTVVWVSSEDGAIAVNSAVGRRWPTNLQRDSHVTVLVYDGPFTFVEIRGHARASLDDARDHANALAKKYTGEDVFTGGRPGEQRIKFTITPDHVRYVETS